MKTGERPIEFLAILPDVQTAINVGGSSGARIKFEVSDEYVPEALKLTLLRNKVFRVRVDEVQEG